MVRALPPLLVSQCAKLQNSLPLLTNALGERNNMLLIGWELQYKTDIIVRLDFCMEKRGLTLKVHAFRISSLYNILL
jgi:hypothetical protein